MTVFPDVKSECASSSDSSEEAMEKELVGLDGDEKDDGDEEEEVEDEEEEECKNEGDKSSNEQKFVAVKTCGSTEENKIPESITTLPLNDRPSTSQSCCDEMKPFQLPDVGDDDSKYKNCKRLLQVPLSPEDLMVKRHRITDIVGGLQSKYLKSRAKRISEQQPCKTKETEIEVITLN